MFLSFVLSEKYAREKKYWQDQYGLLKQKEAEHEDEMKNFEVLKNQNLKLTVKSEFKCRGIQNYPNYIVLTDHVHTYEFIPLMTNTHWYFAINAIRNCLVK